jgi:hypothetical protein
MRWILFAVFSLAVAAFAQDRDRVAPEEQKVPPPSEPKRLFGIIPNYRSSPSLVDYEALKPRQKFKIFAEDAFDRGTVLLAAGFAGEGQLTKATPSFGQGVGGYARYFGTAYADLVIGDFMTEAAFPTLLHQDPRYFRKGTGSGWSRLGWAVKQIVWTHTDSGGSFFNVSEWGGNAAAVAIGNAYYPDNRTASENAKKLGIAVGIDTMSNVMKEFWPDIARKFGKKKQATRVRQTASSWP